MKKEPMDFEALKKEATRRMKGQPPGKGIDTIPHPMVKEFLDVMFYMVREEGRVQTRALYDIIIINSEGRN